MTRRAAGKFVREAICDSKALVVGSSQKTSSRRVVAAMEESMEAVGVVIVSPAREKTC